MERNKIPAATCKQQNNFYSQLHCTSIQSTTHTYGVISNIHAKCGAMHLMEKTKKQNKMKKKERKKETFINSTIHIHIGLAKTKVMIVSEQKGT